MTCRRPPEPGRQRGLPRTTVCADHPGSGPVRDEPGEPVNGINDRQPGLRASSPSGVRNVTHHRRRDNLLRRFWLVHQPGIAAHSVPPLSMCIPGARS